MRLCLLLSCFASCFLVPEAARAQTPEVWTGPPRTVAYLPALDLEAGGAYADTGGGFGTVARVAAGVHRLTGNGILSFGPEATRETGRWVMGIGGEAAHITTGLSFAAVALRDLSSERWGGRASLGLSFLRLGAAVYGGGVRTYSLSLRVPLGLVAAWALGTL